MLWYTLHGTLLVALAWLAWKRQGSVLQNVFWPAWFFKIIATLAVVAVHRQHYPDSDMPSFFNWATELSDRAIHDFPAFFNFLFRPGEGYYTGEARTVFFIKLLSLFALFTKGDMVLMSLWLSMLPFYAACYLVRALVQWKRSLKWPAAAAFLFFPSAVLWTSGILKETVAMACIFLIMAVFLRLWSGKRLCLWEYMLILPSVWIAWKLKYYYVALLLPGMMAAFITRYIGQRLMRFTVLREVLFFKVTFLILVLIPGLFHPNLRPGKLVQVVAESHNQYVQHKDRRHLTNTEIIEPSVTGLLPHIVPAIIHGLFGPWLPDFTHFFYSLAVIENWLLIVITILSLAGFIIPTHENHRILFWATLIYCVSLALWLGIAVPAAGTLVRYKAGFISCWLLLVLSGLKRVIERFKALPRT